VSGLYPSERDYTWIYFAGLVAFTALFLAYLTWYRQQERDRCEAREHGALYVCPDGSQCLCLAKGTVLQ